MDRDVQNLSPQAHKLGPIGLLQGDMLDMDALQQYYMDIINSGGSVGEPNAQNYKISRKEKGGQAAHLQKLYARHLPFKHVGMTKSPINNNNISNGNGNTNNHPHHNSHYNNIVNTTGKVINLSDLPDIMGPRAAYTYYSNTQSSTYSNNGEMSLNDPDRLGASGGGGGKFPDLQTAYRYQIGQADNVSMISNSGPSKSWMRHVVERRKHNNSPVDEPVTERPAQKRQSVMMPVNNGKKRIVVDMPNIIFNSASPDGDEYNNDQLPDHVKGQGYKNHPEGVLRKAAKQQEIRKKELNNLLEDVKELNMRTEVLSNSTDPHVT